MQFANAFHGQSAERRPPPRGDLRRAVELGRKYAPISRNQACRFISEKGKPLTLVWSCDLPGPPRTGLRQVLACTM